MNNLNSINNSGVPYYFPADIAKEGDQYVRISNFLKARVGDNGKVLPFKWYDQGRVMNVHGYIPFIQGLIGKFSTDDNDEVIMAPDASYREWQGSTANAHDGGFIDYILEDQMFPQEGIFKGHFGLKDGNGNVLTSVNIIFEVLGNDLRVCETVKYYVGELENLKNQYRIAGEQTIEEIKKGYNDATENARQTLEMVKQQANITKESQISLNDLVNNTIEYIKVHNIVTLDKYNDLANQIINRLAQMNFKPVWYPNQAAMLKANPNGTQDVCITADTGHKWIYFNGNWQDLGEFAFADIDPKLKKSFLSKTDNIVPNPDFEDNGLFWNFEAATGTANGQIITFPDMNCKRVADLNANTNESISFSSDPIEVSGNKQLSFKALTYYYHSETSTGSAAMGFDVLDDAGNKLDHVVQSVFVGINTTSFDGYEFSDLAKKVRFFFYLAGEGNLRVGKPQASFNAKVGAYSAQEAEAKSNSSVNLLPNSNFANGEHWELVNITGNASGHIVADSWVNGANVFDLTAAGGETISLQADTLPVPVNDNGVLSVSALTSYHHQSDSQGMALLGVDFYDNSGNKLAHISSDNIFKGEIKTTLNSIQIPSRAYSFRFWAYLAGEGNLKIAKPLVSLTTIPELYDIADSRIFTNPDNIVPNANFVTQDGWTFSGATNGAKGYIDTQNAVNASNSVTLTSDNESGSISLQSIQLPVGSNKKISIGALVRSTDDNNSWWGINFNDADGKFLSKVTLSIHKADKNIDSIKENIPIPNNAKYCQIWVYITGKETTNFSRPRINFGEFLKPFTVMELPSKIPVMNITLTKEIGDNWTSGSFTLKNKTEKTTGYLQIGIQGNSSRNFDKKNFKIKLYEDADCQNKLKIRPKSDWDKNFKYNLKANWVDFTQSRNLMSAKLVADAARVTPIANENVEQNLGKSQNMGQMEGFPVELYINGDYHGMYTWNTKKDDKTFGMNSDNSAHEIISVGQKAPDHMFFADTGSIIDGTNWETEIQDKVDPTIQTNFTKFIDWINQSSDTDFVQNLHTYIDVGSVINTMLFGMFSCEYDYYGKSILLATYNQGKTYYMLPYDMDSTWGDDFQGMVKYHTGHDADFDTANVTGAKYINNNNTNLLFSRVLKLMLPDVKKQWNHLRSTVWSTDTVCRAYKSFIGKIPPDEYDKDLAKWPANPSAPDTDYSQIQSFILKRARMMDNWLKD